MVAMRFEWQQLIDLGVSLGADVPFYFWQKCFCQRCGVKLAEIDVPKQWYVIVKPPSMWQQLKFLH